MKTQVTLTQHKLDLIKSKLIQHTLIGLFMIVVTTFNPVSAQTTSNTDFSVKGIVSDETGPLPGVNIVLKGDKIGTTTDENGAFTFPKLLSSGDVLVFSFLGYEKQEIKIDSNTTVINVIMSSTLVEIMGAPNTDKPYKSKRSN